MKIVSYLKEENEQLGIVVDDLLYEIELIHPDIPNTMNMFLNYWDELFPILQAGGVAIRERQFARTKAIPVDRVHLLAPVPLPASCRDGYAFRQHVEAARRNRNLQMIPEFDQDPVFYFTNHHSIQGPGEIRCMPDHFSRLDFELEVAIVIARQGRNIRAAEADSYIAGLMIMNDMSARTLQMEEMLLNLGPAKGKDFSTVIGPWLVTPDELEPFKVPAKKGHTGNNYNLKMKAWVNGKLVSQGNMSDMDWTFAEIIERCAYGVDILPGDVIGSGTVGTGCFLELNGTGKLNDENYQPQWLQPGDLVEMEVTGLGMLGNIIKKAKSDFSILNLKK